MPGTRGNSGHWKKYRGQTIRCAMCGKEVARKQDKSMYCGSACMTEAYIRRRALRNMLKGVPQGQG